MQIPFFDALTESRRVLVAGVGGGFDMASGIPIYLHLKEQGKDVVLANLSFTQLPFTDSKEVFKGTYRVGSDPCEVPYFPEKFVYDWLRARGYEPDIYAFVDELGVQSLRRAYQFLIDMHQVDTLVLVDGGTDSLMFGDEVGVGTIVEDSVSLVAASGLGLDRSFLIATGFGVELHHKLDHFNCLENMAALIQEGAYLGALSLTPEMKFGEAYLDLVKFMNARLPQKSSIVANSIASAMRGEFGDFHFTARTRGTEQFISPLMGLFWFYKLHPIAASIRYRRMIEETETMDQVISEFKKYRAMNDRRPTRKIPL